MDQAHSEFRCRLMHPDFFMTMRYPFPMQPGSPFAEEWTFTPLTELEYPVEVEFVGNGATKPVRHSFGKDSKVGMFERFVLKARVPKEGLTPGSAHFIYEGAEDAALKSFQFDRSLPAADDKWPDIMEMKQAQ